MSVVTAVEQSNEAGRSTDRDRVPARALIVLSFLGALLVQSGFFFSSEWMLGDLAYHRGVAYTMLGGDLQGLGPYRGLISFFGGLYPLGVAGVSVITGWSFDAIVSVVSWFAPLAWPASLWYLGRRWFPESTLTTSVFVALGTLAGPFVGDSGALWVESVLPSGHNFWPLYPRDVALILLVLAIGAAVDRRRWIRTVGLGVLIGIGFLFQAQVAFFVAWIVAANAFRLAFSKSREWQALVDLAVAGAVSLAVSSWWWLPRIPPVLRSDVLLESFPGREPLEMNAVLFLAMFGVAGLFAALGLLRGARDRSWNGPSATLFVWLVSFLPLLVAARLTGDAGFFTERRLWLLLSVPLVGLAAVGVVWVYRQLSAGHGIALLVLVTVVAPIPSTIETFEVVSGAWEPGEWGAQEFDLDTWDPIWSELRQQVRSEAGVTVLTYDSRALATWSFSGATVESLWLPGYVKLGFDPKTETGRSFLERLAKVNEAFAGGFSTICSTANEIEADVILLEEQDGLLAVYDLTPASLFRVDPTQRDLDSTLRSVAPGTTYRDINGWDTVRLSRDATFVLDRWSDASIERIALHIRVTQRTETSILSVTVDGRRVELGAGLPTGRHVLYLDVSGIDGPITVEAIDPFDLDRISGFVATGSERGADGPHLYQVSTAC